jgi:Protein of unknown function (DUF3298)
VIYYTYMKTTAKFGIAIITVVLAAAAVYYISDKKHNTFSPLFNTAHISGKKIMKKTIETDLYTVDIDMDSTNMPNADKLIQSMADSGIALFRFENSPEKLGTKNIDELLMGSPKWLSQWSGSVHSRNSLYTNYILTSYEMTGGAHGNTAVNTLVFDITGQVFVLERLFKTDNEKSVLKLLSEQSRLAIHNKQFVFGDSGDDGSYNDIEIGNDALLSGTAASAENFKNFTIQPDGLHIIFDDYQIAAHAFGQPEIVIYWADLASLLDVATVPGV